MAIRVLVVLVVGCLTVALAQGSGRAGQLESGGDVAGALEVLRESARNGGAEQTFALAEFLDRRNDPDARSTYLKFLQANPADDKKRIALRRLVLLDLMAGDNAAATAHLQQYRAAGGTDMPSAMPTFVKPEPLPTIVIPGPLTSFSRMAALAPDLPAEDILPALARNVVTNGYQASNSQEALEQTEYLKLVFRYLAQARELEKLAGESKILQIDQCDSPKTAELLKVLGYRMRGACGGDVTVETVNASRAFLTIDSGFPLAELEQALRTNRPFTHDYKQTRIPVVYGPEYWLSLDKKEKGEFIDVFMGDPLLCRLYLGYAKLDDVTAAELKKAVPIQRLRAFAHVLDFFGGMMTIRGGKVPVPGGEKSEAAWTELVGAPPSQGAAFLDKLIAKDDGWMASYFDSLSRLEGPAQAYLTDPDRMKRFYGALRGKVTSPGPARPVFRSNTDLMLLTTRLRIDPNGQPHIPGSLDVWKNLFIHHPHGKYDGKLTKSAQGWKAPDDVLEALFALCRKAVENEPLKIFMALTDVNRRRSKPVSPEIADRVARGWRMVSSQIPIFTETDTSDATIAAYLDAMEATNAIKDQSRRADTAGIMQALTGIWQVFTRNSLIPAANADGVLRAIVESVAKAKTESDLFTAGVSGIRAVMAAANAPKAGNPHETMLTMLAGTARPNDEEAHRALVQECGRIFEAQKLISLKVLLDLSDHFEALSKGDKLDTALVNRLQQRMQEIQLPRASLTGAEKNALSFGYWTEKHIESQRKITLRQTLERTGPADAGRLSDARSMLVPILRDTLVGYIYVYYAPPGAQLLKTNPLFVRSHDFLGVQGTNQTWRKTEILGSGWPSSAGGRLVGSLAGLSYALAEAEQNFLIPTREQALIWGDLVPQMVLMAKVPRFWTVTAQQMHWVGLHMRQGESMLAESVLDPEYRSGVMRVLARQAAPARTGKVDKLLSQGNLKGALEHVTASELLMLGVDWASKHPNDESPLMRKARELQEDSPATVNYRAISRVFGTPKPTLTSSFQSELLNLRTFPTLMGYSSRIMAESWESSILYFVGVADEGGTNPGRLNTAIPEWTADAVQRIFATHLEDWPALLRAMRAVGDDIRKGRKGSGNDNASGR
jgi:hypothetical protein